MRKKTDARYNMYEAKTKLSEIVAKACEGQEVILMNRGEPVAKVVAFQEVKPVRKLGFATDIKILPGFDEIPEEFNEYI